MSSTYTVTDFLLDRANIHDTVTKLAWYYDSHSEAGLRDEVFVPEVHVDYSKILGGEPFTIAGPAHLIIELAQPGSSARADTSTILGQYGASMGQPTLEAVRLPELQAKGFNQWTISSQAVTPAWVLGNKGVLEGNHAGGS
ncbi:hypothetical protein UCDDA912_g10277 [Diaporthe ampelina]|uniref:Uncharacterized protein n=1 Tax=Diaporthe ampelina TaxID=1214573 RepID=A0A0G2H3F9_9PEZI|nr:hypothetical protein UCDDA912_g10277 [Diaporthe ampelina]